MFPLNSKEPQVGVEPFILEDPAARGFSLKQVARLENEEAPVNRIIFKIPDQITRQLIGPLGHGYATGTLIHQMLTVYRYRPPPDSTSRRTNSAA